MPDGQSIGPEEEKAATSLKQTVEDLGLGKRTEIPSPTPEQTTRLWMDAWNFAKTPGLENFFSGKEDFPVKAENYSMYMKTFGQYFDAMRRILNGEKLSDINYPFKHEVQYHGSSQTKGKGGYFEGTATTEKVPQIKISPPDESQK